MKAVKVSLFVAVFLGLGCGAHEGLRTDASFDMSTTRRAPPVIPITDADSHQLAKGEWLVKFYAPWCGACERLDPEFQLAAEELAAREPQMRIAAVNIDWNSGLTARFQISRLPTLYHIKNGKIRTPRLNDLTRDAVLMAVQDIKYTAPSPDTSVEPFSFWGDVLFFYGRISAHIVRFAQSHPWWCYFGFMLVMVVGFGAIAYLDDPKPYIPTAAMATLTPACGRKREKKEDTPAAVAKDGDETSDAALDVNVPRKWMNVDMRNRRRSVVQEKED